MTGVVTAKNFVPQRCLYVLLLMLPLSIGETAQLDKSALQESTAPTLYPSSHLELYPNAQAEPAKQNARSDGLSLFDRLFRLDDDPLRSHHIPYPFAKLVETLESQLGVSVNNDANRVKFALFPLGRCINRYASSPEFFRYPRVVLAIDSEHVGKSVTNDLPLKDRFFLGYHEKPGIIDVISYNTAAGRFDFQTVTGYARDSNPVVQNAERDVCVSCHQNEGPIFPLSPYRETDSNPKLFRRILAARQVPPEQATGYTRNEIASVDGSVNRANMFGLFQAFWRAGCRSASGASEVRCRAGLFETILRVRLADIYRIQTPTAYAANFLIPIAEQNVSSLWPDGIAVHSSDIPTQNPLSLGEKAHLLSAELLKRPRTERIVWRPDNLYRIVHGLGQFIPRESIRRLDLALYQKAIKAMSSGENIVDGCRLRLAGRKRWKKSESGLTGELSVTCNWSNSDLSPEISLFTDIRITNGMIRGYPHSGMAIGGKDFILSLTHNGGKVARDKGKLVAGFDLFDSDHYLHARMPDGRIIERVELRWDEQNKRQSPENPDATFAGQGTLKLLKNFDALDKAINALVELQDQGATDVFSDKPFDETKIMHALFSAL